MTDDGTATPAYHALNDDCLKLLGIIHQYDQILQSVAGRTVLSDDELEQTAIADRVLDDVLARRSEWKA